MSGFEVIILTHTHTRTQACLGLWMNAPACRRGLFVVTFPEGQSLPSPPSTRQPGLTDPVSGNIFKTRRERDRDFACVSLLVCIHSITGVMVLWHLTRGGEQPTWVELGSPEYSYILCFVTLVILKNLVCVYACVCWSVCERVLYHRTVYHTDRASFAPLQIWPSDTYLYPCGHTTHTHPPLAHSLTCTDTHTHTIPQERTYLKTDLCACCW